MVNVPGQGERAKVVDRCLTHSPVGEPLDLSIISNVGGGRKKGAYWRRETTIPLKGEDLLPWQTTGGLGASALIGEEEKRKASAGGSDQIKKRFTSCEKGLPLAPQGRKKVREHLSSQRPGRKRGQLFLLWREARIGATSRKGKKDLFLLAQTHKMREGTLHLSSRGSSPMTLRGWGKETKRKSLLPFNTDLEGREGGSAQLSISTKWWSFRKKKSEGP